MMIASSEGDIPPPTFVDPDFPPSLEAIIMKALEVDPAERYQNCDHFFRDLEKFTEEAGIRCSPRMISAYMAEMFGEGAPAEVNYDDQYDDLVDEALDFDKYDALDANRNDAPDWAKSFDAPDNSSTRKKRSMTIGNLEALVAEVQLVQQAKQESGLYGPGGQRRSEAPQTRKPALTPPPGRVPTASRSMVRSGQSMTTAAISALDPSPTTAGTFGHGVVAETNKKGAAALIWLIVIVGLGGLGYVAYTVFSMK
jgi:serine/threonine protein kinase